MSCCRKYSMRVPLNFPARERQYLARIRFTRLRDPDKWASAQKLGLTVRAGEARKLPVWGGNNVENGEPYCDCGPVGVRGSGTRARMADALGHDGNPVRRRR